MDRSQVIQQTEKATSGLNKLNRLEVIKRTRHGHGQLVQVRAILENLTLSL